ncbi:hypothetical protein AAFP30_22210 [Gordonia sp. CPCC 205515]|uniref:hypothetical protein n=1 Tax=Gordonia sp. CPCC 205515 TaxID=3140791 RepID=UPI003AF36230
MNDSRFSLDPIDPNYAEQLWRNNVRLRRLMLVGSMMSGTAVLICIAYLSTSVSPKTLLRIATEAACLSMI